MPSIEIPTGETRELVDREDEKEYFIRVTGAPIKISRVEDERYAEFGITYNRGHVAPVENQQGRTIRAKNVGSQTAIVEIDRKLSDFAAGVFDPDEAPSSAVSVTGGNLDGNQNVDIAEQSLTPLTITDDGAFAISGGTIDPSDRAGRELGKARLEDDTGALIGFGPFHARVTAAATNATVNPGVGGGSGVTIVADTSGAATLTVGVSNDGANWSSYDVAIGGAEGATEQVDGFAYVRASVDVNLNSLDISARGL